MAFSLDPLRNPYNNVILGMIIEQNDDHIVLTANEIDILIEALRVFSSKNKTALAKVK